MEPTDRFDVRIAGGYCLARNVGIALAAQHAHAAARQGYRVWIREKTRDSWAAGTVAVFPAAGCMGVEALDPGGSRFQEAINRMIVEREGTPA